MWRDDDLPPWSGSGGRPRQGYVPPAQMRVSDAERNEIGEILAQHFADGRLDQAEFDERMGRAMGAKTRGELAGLLADLPPLAAAGARPATPQTPPGAGSEAVHRHSGLLALALVLLVITAAPLFVWPQVHLLLWAGVVLIALRASRRWRWRRSWHDGWRW